MDNKSKKKPFNFNILSVIFIYIWAGTFLIAATRIKEPDSRIVPYAISILAIVLATLLLFKDHFKWGKKEVLNFSGSKNAIIMAVLLVAYIGLIELVGFYIATPFYLFLSMWVLGERRKMIMAVISLAMPLLVFLFFDILLKMEIPEGLLLPLLLG